MIDLAPAPCLAAHLYKQTIRGIAAEGEMWCRDSTGRFLPVMSQKRHSCHCCSGLTLFLAFAVHLAALAGPEADLAVWVFLRVAKTR